MIEEENTEALRHLARQAGAPLLGVASMARLRQEEILLPPSLLKRLPFALSVAYHLSDGVLEEIERQPTPLYFQHYQRINLLLDNLGLVLTTAIQERGCQAVPIPASQIVDWETQRGHLSHKHVARAAGLGWIGRNNLLVTERYGARVRLLTVLTDLPLTVDEPLDRDCLDCRDCVQVCPAGAIRERREEFDHRGCHAQLKVFTKTLHFSHQICGVCVKACRAKKNGKSE
jgi:epoxyqueuosine reductase